MTEFDMVWAVRATYRQEGPVAAKAHASRLVTVFGSQEFADRLYRLARTAP